MDIVVKGRKTEVPDRFRKHVAEKLDKIQKLDGKVINLDVEVSKEHNPRQADRSDRVEITLRTRGPVIRAEAAASDPYAALDLAAGKLEARLRKQHDKRRVHHRGHRVPMSVAAATAHLAAELNGEMDAAGGGAGHPGRRRRAPLAADPSRSRVTGRWWCGRRRTPPPPCRWTRRSTKWSWSATTSTLFVDAETKMPSVVYRRHAYDYGVIRLDQDPFAVGAPPGAGGSLGG